MGERGSAGGTTRTGMGDGVLLEELRGQERENGVLLEEL